MRNSKGATVTLRLSHAELAKLQELCEETGHGKSFSSLETPAQGLGCCDRATLDERGSKPLAELALLERLDRAARRMEATWKSWWLMVCWIRGECADRRVDAGEVAVVIAHAWVRGLLWALWERGVEVRILVVNRRSIVR